jgi:hypothetical protein
VNKIINELGWRALEERGGGGGAKYRRVMIIITAPQNAGAVRVNINNNKMALSIKHKVKKVTHLPAPQQSTTGAVEFFMK